MSPHPLTEAWLRWLRVDAIPPLALVLALTLEASAQGIAEPVLLRWLDPSPDPGATGFIVHVERNGTVEDSIHEVGDGSMSEDGRVYSTIVVVGPGETNVSVSATADEGVFATTWSEGSEVRTYHPTTLCDRSDFTADGIVGGPDFAIFASQFGGVCE